MVGVHNPVNVSFISQMKYQPSRISKLSLGFNPSKQRQFESCSSVGWLQEWGCCRAGGVLLCPQCSSSSSRSWQSEGGKESWGLLGAPAEHKAEGQWGTGTLVLFKLLLILG